MANVVVQVTIENLEDLFKVKRGELASEQIRAVRVEDAVVDTDALFLMLPPRLIESLGIRRAITEDDRPITMRKYDAVRLSLQGRDCTMEVFELPDSSPARIGRIPLAAMDWVVDPRNQGIIGNPSHGGQEMVEAY